MVSEVIISLDLPKSVKLELDAMAAREGFKSRSECIRQAIRSYISETNVSALSGNVIATLTIVYDRQKSRENLRSLQHRFEDVVSVQLHCDLREEQCLEVFILRGHAVRITSLMRSVRFIKGVYYSKLTVT